MKVLAKYRLICILALGLLCAALLLNGHLVPAGDNATYIVLGQSLVTGHGYRMISDPRLPEMSLYPPAYPLLLAGLLALTGTARNLLAAILPMKLLTVTLYLAATALTYDLFRRRNAMLATITALLMAVNPHILHFATEVGTEILYLFLSLLCLWLFERYVSPAMRSNWQKSAYGALLWIAVLVVLTFYVRSIALVMAAAFALYLLVRRQFKPVLVLLWVVGVLVAPWFIRSSLLPSTGTSVGLGRGYFALYFSSDPYGTTRASFSDLAVRFGQNLQIYALDIWPEVLFAHVLSVGRLLGRLGLIFIGMFSALLLLGFVLEARRGHVSEWYVALFFASCVGYLWAQSRLIVPIIPFAIYYLLVALHFLLQQVLKRVVAVKRILQGNRESRLRSVSFRGLRSVPCGGVTTALALTSIGLMLSASVVTVDHIQRNLRYGLGQPVATYYATEPEWSNYLQAMNWIAQDANGPAIVMCRKADLMYILTGHQALEYPYSTDGLELMDAVRDNHVAYVIEDAFTWTRTTQQYLRPALQAWRAAQPEALSLVYKTDAPETRVWRVAEPGSATKN